MKPNFALNLSHDGIMLLHRASAGWHVMGEVALDAPDMAEELAQLRALATSVSTAGLATKLVIPNSQILYRSLPDPGPERRDAAIRAALEGATPYALDELIWDSRVTGDRLQVAVIARETLDEAEGFATEYRFNPVSFVALPETDQFDGEPFFGRARAADRLIGPGTKVVPDTEALHILPQRPLPADPVPEALTDIGPKTEGGTGPNIGPEIGPDAPTSDTVQTDEKGARAETESVAESASDTPEAETAPEPLALDNATTVSETETEAQTDKAAPAETEPGVSEPGETAAQTPVETARPDAMPPSGFTSRRTAPSDTGETPSDGPGTTPGETTPGETRSSVKDRPSRVLLSALSGAFTPRDAATDTGAQGKPDDSAGADAKPHLDLEKPDPKPVEHPHVPVTSGDVPLLPETDEAPKPKASRLRADPLPEPPPMPTAAVVAKRPQPDQPAKPRKGARALGALKSLSARAAPKRAAPKLTALKPAKDSAQDSAQPPERQTAVDSLADPKLADPKRADPPPPAIPTPSDPKPKAVTALPGANPDTPSPASSDNTAVDLNRAALSTAGEEIQPLSDRVAGLDRVENPRDEAEALTIFGARRHTRNQDGKPRYLGLILTGGLILLLILIGLVIGMLPDQTQDTGANLTAPDSVELATAPEAPTTEIAEPTDASEPSAAEEAADDLADAEPDSAALAETATETASGTADGTDAAATTDVETTPELVQDATVPAPPASRNEAPALDRDAVAANYAATGIWPLAPESGTGESVEDDLNTLYTASIDPVIASQDAGALPDPTRHSLDSAPRAAQPPAPPGTRYDYDEDGYVRATPEGTATPDGTIVYAGRPAKTPAARPGSAVKDAEAAALSAANDPTNPTRLALAGFRPHLRPEGLVESNEKANLGGMTRAELAAFRPLPRPASAQELADEEARYSGEDQAARTAPVVSVSLRPTPRPANLEKLAAAARAAEEAAAAAADAGTTRSSTATKVTARVPETTLPKGGPANVAQAATTQNVINLRHLNLMGVYGSNSDRRALVRLPSGRFAKVKVGDQLDGGRVQSIGSDSLTYIKRGRSITLEIEG